MIVRNQIIGVILAGGQARRLGGVDKALVRLAGKPLLAYVVERFGPQTGQVILSANGDPTRFDGFAGPVVCDPIPDFAGPLAGLLAAMEWCAVHAPSARWIASVSVDTPFLPFDLVVRLSEAQARAPSDLACARSNGQIHPVAGLWSVSLASDLRRALVDENVHKVDAWAARHKMTIVDFAFRPIDPFFNINRPEDLFEAEALLASRTDKPV